MRRAPVAADSFTTAKPYVDISVSYSPSAPERRRRQTLLEGVEAPEDAGGFLGEDARRLGVLGRGEAVRGHGRPEEAVVGVPAAVVADGRADTLGDAAEVPDQTLDGQLGQGGMVGQGRVEIVDVGGMMRVVVQAHCPLINVRLQRVVGVGQGWEDVRHRAVSSSLTLLFYTSLRAPLSP